MPHPTFRTGPTPYAYTGFCLGGFQPVNPNPGVGSGIEYILNGTLRYLWVLSLQTPSSLNTLSQVGYYQ